MRIVKPVYVNHEDIKENQKDLILTSIYSIDFHPNGGKFATSGGSDKYGIIKIWNMEPIRSKENEMNSNCPKILFEDFSHLKCVNSIKWSPNGKYLASGSIDAVIIIWVQKKLNDLERKSRKFSESYRAAFHLRGHTEDIMDLSWSPHGLYLCSGSIDNKIILWNAEKFPEKIAILGGHTSFIKGVCWDPLGRYLASQSEDKTLRIWRTSDWKQEVKLQDEIDKSHSRCCFNRLSWSPDGSNVVATGTMNNGAPTAQLYNRDNWLKGVDMVGHKQHVICAKYFPTLLRCRETQQEFLLLALGSKDRSLSVWTTLRRRPLTVVTDLFSMSIIDLSWYVNKFELIACSLDGSIAYLQFTEAELGTPLSSDEMNKYFEKTYGSGFVAESTSLSKTKSFILPESCAVLELQRKQKGNLDNKELVYTPPIHNERQTGPKEQIVQRTQAGKRRITPKFISAIDYEDIEPDPVPLKKLVTTEDNLSEQKSSISPKKNSSSSTEKNVSSSSEKTSSISCERSSATDKDSVQTKDEDLPILEKTKLVSKHKLLEEKFVKPESPIISSSSSEDRRDSSNGKLKLLKNDEKSIDIKSPRKEDVHKLQNHLDNKNQKKDDATTEADWKLPKSINIVVDTKDLHRSLLYKDTLERMNVDSIKPLDTSTLKVSNSEDVTKKLPRETKTVLTERRHQLIQPVIKNGSSIVGNYPGEIIPYNIKILTDSASDGKLYKVSVCLGEQKLWDVTLSTAVSVVIHQRDKIFLGDVSGNLNTFYLKGGRFIAPLLLDAGVVQLECDGEYLFAVTSKATLFVWKMSPMSILMKESFLHLLTDDGDKTIVKTIAMNGERNVSILFEGGSAYVFNKLLGAWHEIYNNSNKYESWSISRLITKSIPTLPLSKMQSSQHNIDESLKGLSAATKLELRLDRLEIQMKLSESLNSSEEYKYWLIMFMRSLIDANKEQRVREICQDLLGPVNRSTRSDWKPFIQNFSKRELLKEIIPLLPLNLRLQHLYTEFSDQLEMLSLR